MHGRLKFGSVGQSVNSGVNAYVKCKFQIYKYHTANSQKVVVPISIWHLLLLFYVFCRAQRGSDLNVFEIRMWTARKEMEYIEARWWNFMHWQWISSSPINRLVIHVKIAVFRIFYWVPTFSHTKGIPGESHFIITVAILDSLLTSNFVTWSAAFA